MRTQAITELPPSKETGRCDLIKTVIVGALTTYRCHVKTCVRCLFFRTRVIWFRCQVFKALTELQPELSPEVFPSGPDEETPKETSQKGRVVDIATLTRNCIGTAPMQPTAALYQRIAFIVCHPRSCSGLLSLISFYSASVPGNVTETGPRRASSGKEWTRNSCCTATLEKARRGCNSELFIFKYWLTVLIPYFQPFQY